MFIRLAVMYTTCYQSFCEDGGVAKVGVKICPTELNCDTLDLEVVGPCWLAAPASYCPIGLAGTNGNSYNDLVTDRSQLPFGSGLQDRRPYSAADSFNC